MKIGDFSHANSKLKKWVVLIMYPYRFLFFFFLNFFANYYVLTLRIELSIPPHGLSCKVQGKKVHLYSFSITWNRFNYVLYHLCYIITWVAELSLSTGLGFCILLVTYMSLLVNIIFKKYYYNIIILFRDIKSQFLFKRIQLIFSVFLLKINVNFLTFTNKII